ncbi:hypothetical protein TELCIR_07711 [Teladorsagia circumcincta]|uniref:Uncharacterized protein n=1 Tax=Teladorsagia circumcincta TaxID=45464 RepID=A0A2G9UJK7_TELCI|nr:hypothetical protein TELCIR_07711 [Teladorsagia circumcincta]
MGEGNAFVLPLYIPHCSTTASSRSSNPAAIGELTGHYDCKRLHFPLLINSKSEGSAILNGLGYNGKDEKGEDRLFLIIRTRVWLCDGSRAG